MSVGSQQFAVATTPQLIASTPAVSTPGPQAAVIVATSANIYLGGAGVTASTGLAMTSSSAPLNITLYAGDVLYAVAATSATVSVLQT